MEKQTKNFYLGTYQSGNETVVFIRNTGCASVRYPNCVDTYTIGPRNAKKLDLESLDGLTYAEACDKVSPLSKHDFWREY